MTTVRIWLPFLDDQKVEKQRFWKDVELPGVPRTGEEVVVSGSVPVSLPVNKVWWSFGDDGRVHVELSALNNRSQFNSPAILMGVGWREEQQDPAQDE